MPVLTLEAALAELPPLVRPLKPLTPSFLDPREWRPSGTRPPAGWDALRARIIARDGGCVYCGQGESSERRSRLEVNHLNGHRDNRPEALETVCVLCHRVLHAGRSAAIYGSLVLFRRAGCDQNNLIRLCWWLRTTRRLADRPLMELLGLHEQAQFRMDRPYLSTLYGYVPERYWLLERRPVSYS
ncbi:MAG: hypothetical protein JWO42_3864 [Chloroflexi bacterium]|nr:hypothetical protein [Chloroflexota bacterium]